jgi:hypothetical protein
MVCKVDIETGLIVSRYGRIETVRKIAKDKSESILRQYSGLSMEGLETSPKIYITV